MPPTVDDDSAVHSSPNEATGAPVFFSRRAVGGVPWAILNNIVQFFVFFGTTAILTRVLGTAGWETLAVCRNIGDVALLVCSLGLNVAVLRYVPELIRRKNRSGLVTFLLKTSSLQFAAGLLCFILFWFATPLFDGFFDRQFGYLLAFTSLFIVARLLKQFVDDVLTAMFEMRTMTMISIAQGLARVGLTAGLLWLVPEVYMALTAHAVSIIPIGLVGLVFLIGRVRAVPMDEESYGIGNRRLLLLAGPRFTNSLLTKLMSKYSEVFLLGRYWHATAAAGIYDLAYTVPLMIVTTLPMALQKLYYSAFADAYAEDKNSIPRLMTSFYKMLIVMTLPISVFLAGFSLELIPVYLGAEYAKAGEIAIWLTIFHTVTLVSVPIGAAMVTLEKLYVTTPIIAGQLALNLVLDVILIPRYGLYGALVAVFATYFITIPLRMYIVTKIVGGVYFPTAFFFRMLIPLSLLVLAARPIAPHLNMVTFVVFGAVYGVLVLAMIRYLRLVRPEDVADFRALGIQKLNRVLDRLVPE